MHPIIWPQTSMNIQYRPTNYWYQERRLTRSSTNLFPDKMCDVINRFDPNYLHSKWHNKWQSCATCQWHYHCDLQASSAGLVMNMVDYERCCGLSRNASTSLRKASTFWNSQDTPNITRCTEITSVITIPALQSSPAHTVLFHRQQLSTACILAAVWKLYTAAA